MTTLCGCGHDVKITTAKVAKTGGDIPMFSTPDSAVVKGSDHRNNEGSESLLDDGLATKGDYTKI